MKNYILMIREIDKLFSIQICFIKIKNEYFSLIYSLSILNCQEDRVV